MKRARYRRDCAMVRIVFGLVAATCFAASGSAAPGSAGSSAQAVPVPAIGYASGCFDAAATHRAMRPALRICDNALGDSALSPANRAATLVNRGIILMEWGQPAAAIADFDTAIGLRPEFAEAYVNKGIALLRIGNRDVEAVTTLSQGIARNPLRPEIAYYQRAVANEELGRVREAYEDYSRAAALAPEWADPAEQLQRFQTVRKKTLMG
jgi:tetratricopeptide (TPR) repeat protein